jgi:hypothetical protein
LVSNFLASIFLILKLKFKKPKNQSFNHNNSQETQVKVSKPNNKKGEHEESKNLS